MATLQNALELYNVLLYNEDVTKVQIEKELGWKGNTAYRALDLLTYIAYVTEHVKGRNVYYNVYGPLFSNCEKKKTTEEGLKGNWIPWKKHGNYLINDKGEIYSTHRKKRITPWEYGKYRLQTKNGCYYYRADDIKKEYSTLQDAQSGVQ